MTSPENKFLATEELQQIRSRCDKATPGPWVTAIKLS